MKNINNIFVIDDDSITLFGLKKILSKLSPKTNVEDFKNGQLAIDTIKEKLEQGQHLPEVIFLDINMPILDGWGFLKEFVELQVKDKMLINIITSSIDPADREQWLYYKERTHHHIDFMTKPIYKLEHSDLYKIDKAS